LIEFIIPNSFMLAADPGGGSGMSLLILFAPLFAIWYFLLIRPQQQQRRKLQDLIAQLKQGDRVVTNGGIHGTIASFRDSVVQLQVAKGVTIDVERSAITGLEKEESGEPGKKQ
jgi:preprotein translocase subunit YajC